MRDISILAAAVQKLYRQVLLMIGRGRILLVDDTQVVQYAQVRLGQNEIRDNAPRVQEYGFSSNPPDNTDAIMVFVAGDRSNGCIIATNNQQYRLKNLPKGGVALYDMFGNTVILTQSGIAINDVTGNYISMNENGISLTSPGTITLNGQNVVIHANQTLKYDADGNGTAIASTTRTDYDIGSTGSSAAISPPQIP